MGADTQQPGTQLRGAAQGESSEPGAFGRREGEYGAERGGLPPQQALPACLAVCYRQFPGGSEREESEGVKRPGPSWERI